MTTYQSSAATTTTDIDAVTVSNPPWHLVATDDTSIERAITIQGDDMKFAGAWTTDGTYFSGDVVRVSTSAYVCISNSTPATSTVYCKDTFIRTNQTDLGTSSDGHAWGFVPGISIHHYNSIVSNQAQLTKDVSGNSDWVYQITPSTCNNGCLVKWKQTASGDTGNYIEFAVNSIVGGILYGLTYCRISILQPRVNMAIGSPSSVSTNTFDSTSVPSYPLNTVLWTRVEHVSDTLQVKTWVDGTPEPLTWDQQLTFGTSIPLGNFVIHLGDFNTGSTSTYILEFIEFYTLTPAPWEDATKWQLLAQGS